MNKKYGKLIEGVLIFAPINLVVDDMQVINAEEADYISAGYLPIQYTIKPDDNEWQAVYTEVDAVILQSWIYKGRPHDHSNLPLLEGVTAESLSGVPAVHILPTDAKDGDMCLYAPQNTLTLADSGKRIYFDWEEFRKPVGENDATDFFAQIIKNNGEQNTTIELRKTNEESHCFIEDYTANIMLDVGFVNGVLIFAYYGDTEYNSIEEIPTYYQLPQFDTISNSTLTGNAYLFHTEYKLMKYQGGEWVEAVESGVTQTEMQEYVAAAINGSLDEIEAMIDESGVLDE